MTMISVDKIYDANSYKNKTTINMKLQKERFCIFPAFQENCPTRDRSLQVSEQDLTSGRRFRIQVQVQMRLAGRIPRSVLPGRMPSVHSRRGPSPCRRSQPKRNTECIPQPSGSPLGLRRPKIRVGIQLRRTRRTSACDVNRRVNGVAHRVGSRQVLAGDIKSGAVIGRRPDNWQAGCEGREPGSRLG